LVGITGAPGGCRFGVDLDGRSFTNTVASPRRHEQGSKQTCATVVRSVHHRWRHSRRPCLRSPGNRLRSQRIAGIRSIHAPGEKGDYTLGSSRVHCDGDSHLYSLEGSRTFLLRILWHMDRLTWNLCKASSRSVERMALESFAPHSSISFRIAPGATCPLITLFRALVVFHLEQNCRPCLHLAGLGRGRIFRLSLPTAFRD
jgi:hypothetical protein